MQIVKQYQDAGRSLSVYLTCFIVLFLSTFFLLYTIFLFPYVGEVKMSSFYPCLPAWKWMVLDTDLI